MILIINGVLVRVKTSALKGDIHFEFQTENAAIFSEFGTDRLGIQEYIDLFMEGLKNEKMALAHIIKSVETERIAIADVKFDYTFAGLRDYVNSCLRHYDENSRLSAENLDVVFEKYGNIALHPYRQQLSESDNLLDELGKHSVDIQAINLSPWMNAHKAAHEELKTLLNKRTDEIAQQTDFRLKETRRQVDIIYLQILDRLESMINIHGKEFVPGFVSKYNAHATEYKNKYAQHIGYIQANKNKGKEDENKPTDTEERADDWINRRTEE
jgi:hypothetical protein